MSEPIDLAKKLATQLVERRLPNLENDLAKVLRGLGTEHKLEIIMQIMHKNVRAAAALAARGDLSAEQQILLLQHLLETGGANAMKFMVSDVFVRRMSAKVFFNYLYERRVQFPVEVHFAIYYFLGAGKIDSETRISMRALLVETKPSAPGGDTPVDMQ
ncbi:hypothetical protein [Pseudomonas sp. MWU12-2345]|uniref:hypothetical protein n=1 Tax=Pseudomonas sp. MWU12-2345 TaxID=2928689 RepID=UPI00200F7527|nr:hypothetical protein [Pseudomonas sp. MWU12-2345]